jgi:hypothetical protein
MATPGPKRLSSGRGAALAIWVVLAAAYVATLGADAVPGHDYSVAEGHALLGAWALADHHNLDVRGYYRTRSTSFDSPRLRPEGVVRKGVLYEPHAIGLPLLAAPFYALGGAKAVECLIAALLAAAVAFGYLLARRVVPDPWCAVAALAVGLSPPLVASGTAVVPDPVAAFALAGAALCAARLRDGPSRFAAAACFVLLGSLPWVGVTYLAPGVIVGWAAIRSLRRAGRGLLALGSTEVAFFSLALLVGLNEALFGGPTPHAADPGGTSATGADGLADYVGRCWRIVALFLDQHYGLIRWAPIAALAFGGLWVLYRSAREQFARAISGLEEEHGVARLCGWAALAGVVMVALFVPSLDAGSYPTIQVIAFVPLALPLVALGIRQTPHVAVALALIGVGGSVWLWIDARTGGGLVSNRPSAPWGPLVTVFPEFRGDVWPNALLYAVLVALAAPVVREEIDVRRRLG